MIMERSGEERLKIRLLNVRCCEGDDAGCILDRNPHVSPAEIRRALFMQRYGHEFDVDSVEKILVAIESATHPVAR